MHQEEIDLCWRAFNQGFNVFCIGESHIYHKGHQLLIIIIKKIILILEILFLRY